METVPTPFHEILADVEAYLRQLAAEGTPRVPVNPQTVERLGRPPPAPSPAELLAAVARRVAACRRCPLHATRTHTVPGTGTDRPEILFVGEAPGEDEDLQGKPFVGRAGELLTRMIEAMGFRREEVFIANVLKCRPPNNRTPLPEEMACCLPFLREQIAILKPRVIVALGNTAIQGLLGQVGGITRLHGQWLKFEGMDLMPTFHPAYLLRNPPAKHDAWKDLQAVLARLGRKPPPRKSAAEPQAQS